MNIRTFRASRQQGSILGYYIIVLFVLGAIASVAGFVVQHVQLSKRRSDRKNALEYSEGAALIACQELNKAYTNSSSFFTNLHDALRSKVEVVEILSADEIALRLRRIRNAPRG